MFKHLCGDRWLALVTSVAALALVFVWVPLDVDTGLVETVRRQTALGDSLGPVIAGTVILLGGIMTWMQPNANSPQLTGDNLRWLAMLLMAVTGAMVLMRYVGPALVDMFVDPPYRAMRATPPWNYVGYLLGGTFLIRHWSP